VQLTNYVKVPGLNNAYTNCKKCWSAIIILCFVFCC